VRRDSREAKLKSAVSVSKPASADVDDILPDPATAAGAAAAHTICLHASLQYTHTRLAAFCLGLTG